MNILLEELRDENRSGLAEQEHEDLVPAVVAAFERRTRQLAAERHVLPLACLGSGCLCAFTVVLIWFVRSWSQHVFMRINCGLMLQVSIALEVALPSATNLMRSSIQSSWRSAQKMWHNTVTG